MLRAMPSLMVVITLLLGCGGESTRTEENSGAARDITFPTELAQIQAVHHLDKIQAREPMVVEHPDGTLFVAGWPLNPDHGTPPQLWNSIDAGQTWKRVDVGAAADGARGNSDVDLAIGAGGTLYFIAMGFSWDDLHGTHIAVGSSHDKGASWSWTILSEEPYSDRPWVAVAPDNTAHAIWNDATGVNHAVSTDFGRTWEEWPRVHPAGMSSHLAIGPRGELAVRITPLSGSGYRPNEGLDLIAVSTDGGRTWLKHDVPGKRDWDPTMIDATKVPRWVEPVAWDADSALYTLWSEGEELMLGRSADQGASWATWLAADDDRAVYYPYLIARDAGELAATWFSGLDDELAVNVAIVRASTSENDELLITRAKPFQQDAWTEREGVVISDTAGEYVPVIFLGDTELGVVTTLQDVRGDWQQGYENHGDHQGFTWRRFAEK